MISLLQKSLLLLFALQAVLPASIVKTDTGPKPTMEFEFKQELSGEPVTIVSGTLYECKQSDCSDASPLEQVGPQGFNCSADRCDAMAYGFSQYHRLELEFSDGRTRESNIFETAGFDSRYLVTVQPEGLLVESQFSSPVSPRITILLLLCTCLVCGGILVVALIVLLIRRFTRT